VNNRHKRRAELARFRRETGGALLTWLVDANDPAMREAPPLLVRAAHLWCENLPASPRHCICCLTLIWNRREVGALLLSMPVNATSSMSVNAVCNRCWADQPLDEIELAATDVFRAVVPNGYFEALPCQTGRNLRDDMPSAPPPVLTYGGRVCRSSEGLA